MNQADVRNIGRRPYQHQLRHRLSSTKEDRVLHRTSRSGGRSAANLISSQLSMRLVRDRECADHFDIFGLAQGVWV